MKYQEVIDNIKKGHKQRDTLASLPLRRAGEPEKELPKPYGEDARGTSDRLGIQQPPAYGAPAVCPSLRTLDAKYRDGHARLP